MLTCYFDTDCQLCTYKYEEVCGRALFVETDLEETQQFQKRKKKKRDRGKNKQVTQGWRDRPNRRERNQNVKHDALQRPQRTTLAPLLDVFTFLYHATWKWELVSIVTNKAIRSRTANNLLLVPHHLRIQTIKKYKDKVLMNQKDVGASQSIIKVPY